MFLLGLTGVFVFAISGALAAVSRQMDILGMLVLAIVTAVGGGTLRSILIGDFPIAFFQDELYLIACIFATMLVFFCHRAIKQFKKPIIFFDAIGLGIFMALGISTALQKGLEPWACLILGVITASFGGVLRDVLSARVPLIFRSEFYASACLLGGAVYFLLGQLGVREEHLLISTTLSVTTIRMLGVHYSWKLPKAPL